MVLDPNATVCRSSPSVQAGATVYNPVKLNILDAVLAIDLLWTVFCLGVFWAAKRSRRYEHLRLRPMTLVAFLAVMNGLYMFYGLLGLIINHANVPCGLDLAALLMVIPFGGTAIIGRLLALYLMNKYQLAMTQLHQEFDVMASVTSTTDEADVPEASSNNFCAAFFLLLGFLSANAKSKPATVASSRRILANLKFLVSRRGRLSIMAAITLPFFLVFILILFTDPAYVAGCGNCIAGSSVFFVLVAFGFVVVTGSLSLAWIVRNYPDRWGQARECRYLAMFAFGALIFFVIDALTNIQDFVLDFQIPLAICFAAMLGTSTIWQVYIAVRKERDLRVARRRSKKLPSQIESNAASAFGDTNALESILGDAELAKKFEAHLTAELGLESLLFIRVVQDWKSHYYDLSAQSRAARAKKIMDNYIDVRGNFAINIPADVSDAIMALRRSNDVPLTVFDEAAKEMRHMLEHGALVRFQQNQQKQQQQQQQQQIVVPS